MFDLDWIFDLDPDQAADELARARDLLRTAETSRFLLAAHWADLHAGSFVDDCRRALPGMPRLVDVAPDCPAIDEFAGTELAALTGTSTHNGERLIRDALLVRHRHPQLWTAIKSGRVDVWVAVKVAQRCAAAGLDAQQVAHVDAQTTPYLTTLPLKRFFDLVEAKIVEADPDAAEERATAESLARFVRSGRADEHGMKTLVARAGAGDITYLVAVLDRVAVILAEQGDHTSIDVRRATALRILANPARALALLTGATLERLDTAVETTDEAEGDMHLGGECSWMTDITGMPLPGLPSHADLVPMDLADVGVDVFPGLGGLVAGSPPAPGAATPADGRDSVEEAHDPALLHALMDSLERFESRKMDPLTVFHVHVTGQTLANRRGVARVEELGAAALGEVRDWLTHPMFPEQIQQQVRVRPVLDAEAVRSVDAYEWPSTMSELATVRSPYDVFPYGTLGSRSCEDDHVVPYRRDGGPPRQTTLGNNAKLSKRHHRIKTFGGWALLHTEPGVYLWRTRHGHWLRVDPSGTHHLGRDPALDADWRAELAERQASTAAA